ncbi:MAG TPA: patatin-like phospholipase family protein [Candidatus Acidoferrales bacterium]|nr:patatin-like phospholipase family protein [Candidatus Acidoferrales bacterium]
MSNVLQWIGSAVKGIRSFAYREPAGRPIVGVALGGGFARGIAHIGVLRVLEENEIPIDLLAGTSVGALVGAAYASGTTLDELERQGILTRFRDFGRWTISRMGMATNERLEVFLRRFTPVSTFEEMKIPFGIVATDLVTGQTICFTKGAVGPALRASCAYPGLFIPVEYEGRMLVDGFLTEHVPTESLRHMGADVIIAVHLDPGQPDQKPKNTIEVIGRAFSIIQEQTPPRWLRFADVILEPVVKNIHWDDFQKTPELVAAGVAAAKAALPEIKEALKKPMPGLRGERRSGEDSKRTRIPAMSAEGIAENK